MQSDVAKQLLNFTASSTVSWCHNLTSGHNCICYLSCLSNSVSYKCSILLRIWWMWYTLTPLGLEWVSMSDAQIHLLLALSVTSLLLLHSPLMCLLCRINFSRSTHINPTVIQLSTVNTLFLFKHIGTDVLLGFKYCTLLD